MKAKLRDSGCQIARPVAIDLFAGAGGLSLGLEQAGFDVGVVVEQAKGPSATHRLNFPTTTVLQRDVSLVHASDIRSILRARFSESGVRWNGELALAAGGPPCQGYSGGGRHRPDDERNTLVHEFRRLVTTLESRYFVMENVPGLLFEAHSRTLDALIESFHRAGYEVAEPFVVDASQFGLPQTRRRVLLIGWKKGENAVDVGALQRTERARTSVAEAIGDLPEIDLIPALLTGDTFVASSRRDTKRTPYVETMQNVSLGHTGGRSWDGRTLTGCARTVHSREVVARFRSTVPGETESISRYRRLAAEGLAPTLRAGTGPEHGSHTSPRPIHHYAPRVISVREAARLQSFPDWFVFAGTKWHAWQELGNAVPPLLAREVGAAVLQALSDKSAVVVRE